MKKSKIKQKLIQLKTHCNSNASIDVPIQKYTGKHVVNAVANVTVVIIITLVKGVPP